MSGSITPMVYVCPRRPRARRVRPVAELVDRPAHLRAHLGAGAVGVAQHLGHGGGGHLGVPGDVDDGDPAGRCWRLHPVPSVDVGNVAAECTDGALLARRMSTRVAPAVAVDRAAAVTVAQPAGILTSRGALLGSAHTFGKRYPRIPRRRVSPGPGRQRRDEVDDVSSRVTGADSRMKRFKEGEVRRDARPDEHFRTTTTPAPAPGPAQPHHAALVVRAAGAAAVRLRRPGAERSRRVLRLHRLGRPGPRASPSSAWTTSPTCSATPTRVQAIWHTLLIAVSITVIQNGLGLLLALGVNSDHQVPQRAAGVPVRPGGDHADRHRLPVAQPARPGRRGQQPARRGRAGRRGGRTGWAIRELALWSVVGVIVWQFAGYSMVIFLAGLQSVPKEIYEAAAIDGGGPGAALLVGHPAAARAGVHHQPDAVDHRRDQALRPGVRADRRRAGARHRHPLDADLQGRLHAGRVRLQHRPRGRAHRSSSRSPRPGSTSCCPATRGPRHEPLPPAHASRWNW